MNYCYLEKIMYIILGSNIQIIREKFQKKKNCENIIEFVYCSKSKMMEYSLIYKIGKIFWIEIPGYGLNPQPLTQTCKEALLPSTCEKKLHS